MYCHTSTDRPNEAPSETATVPTMTIAAIRLRVMSIMISRIRLSEANADDQAGRTWRQSWMSL